LLPSLSCPDPALVDTHAPDPLSPCYGHHPGEVPAIAKHPDVHQVDPAAVALVLLLVGRGALNMLIVLKAVWNSGVTVAANETLDEVGAPQNDCYRTDVEAEQALVAGLVIEHGHSSLLHNAVRR
jgi:hypothetical protein